MELVQETFLQRLEYLRAELRAIAQSPELRQLVQSDYDPDLTIIDAVHAISEVIDAWEQNAGVFQLQPGQAPLFSEFEKYFENLTHEEPE